MNHIRLFQILSAIAIASFNAGDANAYKYSDILVDAANNNDNATVRYLLENEHRVDQVGSFGITSLMRAANQGNANVVKFLLEKGADANQKDISGTAALHLAARNQNYDIITALIENGADVNASNEEGWTPLMRSALLEDSKVSKILIENGADVNTTNEWGEYPVLLAARLGNKKVIHELLDTGLISDEHLSQARNESHQRGYTELASYMDSYIQTDDTVQVAEQKPEVNIDIVDNIPEVTTVTVAVVAEAVTPNKEGTWNKISSLFKTENKEKSLNNKDLPAIPGNNVTSSTQPTDDNFLSSLKNLFKKKEKEEDLFMKSYNKNLKENASISDVRNLPPEVAAVQLNNEPRLDQQPLSLLPEQSDDKSDFAYVAAINNTQETNEVSPVIAKPVDIIDQIVTDKDIYLIAFEYKKTLEQAQEYQSDIYSKHSTILGDKFLFITKSKTRGNDIKYMLRGGAYTNVRDAVNKCNNFSSSGVDCKIVKTRRIPVEMLESVL